MCRHVQSGQDERHGPGAACGTADDLPARAFTETWLVLEFCDKGNLQARAEPYHWLSTVPVHGHSPCVPISCTLCRVVPARDQAAYIACDRGGCWISRVLGAASIPGASPQ